MAKEEKNDSKRKSSRRGVVGGGQSLMKENLCSTGGLCCLLEQLGKKPSSNAYLWNDDHYNLFCWAGTPRLRTLGEVAPENVYSDRTFSYLSEVRKKEAEEWIRSSTPREFTRDFAGEENFAKAMVRLREGMLAVMEMPEQTHRELPFILLPRN